MSVLSLFNRKTQGGASKPLPKLVLDLDSVIVDSISFRFMGTDHVIEPIDTRNFLKLSQVLVQMDAMQKSKELSSTQVIDIYAELFGMVCPTITKSLIMKMSSPQLLRLHALILDCISGKAYADQPETDQKKNLGTT